MAERNFESLRVWQNARVFVNEIYDLMADNNDWGFRDQIQRASVSIMNNIAEGFESGSDTKYANYLNISKEVVLKFAICCTSALIESIVHKNSLKV